MNSGLFVARVAARVVAGASCYRLVASEREAAAELIDSLVAER
jgi:hypothetical protein